MKRRTFMASIAGGLIAPLSPFAQPTRKLSRVGYLIPTKRAGTATLLALFIDGRRARGYVEGERLELELRTAEGDYDRLPRSRPSLQSQRRVIPSR